MANKPKTERTGMPPPLTSLNLTKGARDLLFALKEQQALPSLAAVVEKLAKDQASRVEVLFTPQEMFALKLRHLKAGETPSDGVRRLLREAGAFDTLEKDL